MTDTSSTNPVPKAVRSIYPPLVLMAVAIGMIVWSLNYGETAREVPVLVAGSLLVLAVIDLVCRFDVPRLRPLRDFWGADFRNREMKHNPSVREEFALAFWMLGCVAGMMTIGILPTVPIFIFLYMTINGRRPWLESLLVAVVVFAFVYAVFEILLDYRLYRGALFDSRGFRGW